MSTTEARIIDTVAEDFRTRMQGKLADHEIDAAVASLKAATNKYPASGSVASAIFYLKWKLTVKGGGKTFEGHAGGVSIPGGGAITGDVYTDDLNRLYRETISFQCTATPVYVNLLFFNSKRVLLGHFEGDAVSTVTGPGGGSGKWS